MGNNIPNFVGVTLTNRLGGEEEGVTLDDSKNTQGYNDNCVKYLADRNAVGAVSTV